VQRFIVALCGLGAIFLGIITFETLAFGHPAPLDDRIRSIAKATLGGAQIANLSYEGVQTFPYDDPDADVAQPTGMWDAPIEKAPKGARDIVVNYHLPEVPSADDDEAKFAATLFQKLFALDPSVWRVAVSFSGPLKDEYGHTDERTYVGYTIYRPTFRKIDWRGFDTVSLCSFLRRENSGDLAQDGEPKGGDGCDLWPEISTAN